VALVGGLAEAVQNILVLGLVVLAHQDKVMMVVVRMLVI
jgi:hypothetical protein